MDSELAKVIATALWGQIPADLYFDPRYADNPDIRKVQAIDAATAVLQHLSEVTPERIEAGRAAVRHVRMRDDELSAIFLAMLKG